ncbi:MAG: CBS domain-containing protein [Chitinophagaceae bacterium]|nr:CBS domain-containing protein [Chitinophagaceae bacterium]
MNLVKHLLNRKSGKLVTASPNHSVREALTLMAKNDVGAVVVMDGDQFKGILTERDYSRKIILKDRNSRDTTVEEIMSKDLPGVSPTDTIEHCMELLDEHHIRYLPVFDGGKLAGIVSISDLIKETLLIQQRTIDQLENYIRG